MAKLHTVKPSSGKGNGTFADTKIVSGTIILMKKVAVTLPISFKDEDVLQAFQGLPSTDQHKFLQLHEGHRPLKTKLMRIMKANVFGDEKHARLFLEVSLINHSCVPNAQLVYPNDSEVHVVAIKPLRKGDEVFISYYQDLAERMTTEQRNTILLAYHGFRCNCGTCTLRGGLRTISNARRQLINVLASGLQGTQPLDYRMLDLLRHDTAERLSSVLAFALVPLTKPLNLRQQTAYNLLLAGLLAAEGLLDTSTAALWAGAAEAVRWQAMEHEQIVIVSAMKHVKDWTLKATDVAGVVNGTNAKFLHDLRRSWADMQMSKPLQVYNMLTSIQNKVVGPGPKHDDFFAVRVNEEVNFGGKAGLGITGLSRKQCIAYLHGERQSQS